MRFDETAHIRDIFQEELLSLKSAYMQNGHRIAMLRSRSGMTLGASLQEDISGIARMQILREFLAMDDEALRDALVSVYRKATALFPIRVMVETEIDIDFLSEFTRSDMPETRLDIDFTPSSVNEAWITDLAVSYCALSVQTVSHEHPDAPVLRILAQFLRDGYLHSAIREQGGAYGAGAAYDEHSGGFSFYSYRDPRIVGTFDDFARSLTWFLETTHDPLRLEEAKLGVFSGMDAPKSLASEAIGDMQNHLFGYTESVKNEWRKKLLAVTIEDMHRVVETYLLSPNESHRVVITGPQNRSVVENMGLEVRDLS